MITAPLRGVGATVGQCPSPALQTKISSKKEWEEGRRASLSVNCVARGKADTEDDLSNSILTHSPRSPQKGLGIGHCQGGSLGDVGDYVRRREVRG